ncbi:hypothetical protein CsSME_00032738 [Camellia sinensis var. sinensis]
MAENDSHSQFLAIAVEAAKIAGDVIRKGFYQTKHVEHKGEVDLVTETDKACEDHIFNHLKEHFPHHKFIGEETTAACGVTELTDEPTWIVDPLDGTTNFVHGFPFVCVSIGLTIGKVPTVGVVYNPIMDEVRSLNFRTFFCSYIYIYIYIGTPTICYLMVNLYSLLIQAWNYSCEQSIREYGWDNQFNLIDTLPGWFPMC